MTWKGLKVNPAPFMGSEAEQQANRNTHSWGVPYEKILFNKKVVWRDCLKCGCTESDGLSDYPCGAEVPLLYDDEWLNAMAHRDKLRNSDS